MKILTKKLTLIALSVLFAVCAAFTATTLIKDVARADDPTVVNVTFNNINTYNNRQIGAGYFTKLAFNVGVSTGTLNARTGDYSNLSANMTFTGSGNISFRNAALGFTSTGDTKSDDTYNYIIMEMNVAPALGDTIKINSGAWFTTGGTINDKYVLTDDISLYFNGTAWVQLTAFTLDVPYGGNGSGWDGITYAAQQTNLAKFGIEWETWNNINNFIVPTSGTCILTSPNTNVFASGSTPSDNIVSSVTGVTIDGVELKNIEGSVIAEWFTNLFIYIPGVRGGVVKIEKDTIIAGHYAADDYYYVLSDVTTRVQWFTANSAANTTAISNNTTSPDADGLLWNGSNASGTVTIAGIAPGVPESGSCGLINMETAVFGSMPKTNLVYATAGATILCDGTPLNEISGAAIGTFANYLFIYVPNEDCIINIQKDTIIGNSNYKIDKDYTYHFKKGANQSSLCYLARFDSDGGTAVDSVYVHNGSTLSEPTAPTKATVGDTEYVFAGWVDDNDDAYDFSAAVNSDITLTATWTEITVESKTFGGFNADENNLANGYGALYATRLCFTTGVNSGGSTGADFSDLIANSTYSGSENNFGFVQGCAKWLPGYKSDSVFNFIYLWTENSPEEGDTIVINAGAWFKTGGDGNYDKYVIASDIGLYFNGSAWQLASSFFVIDSRDGSIIGTYYHSKDGDNYVYRMPTNINYDGYKVFGFALTDGGVEYFYPAGATHTSAASDLVLIAIIGTFDMASGASIRITNAETSGIRWSASVDSAARGHVLYWGKTGTTFGMEISAEGFAENFDIKTKFWVNDTDYNAVLTDINSDYYTTDFTAKAYVDIAYSDGTTTRFYASESGVTRNISEVASAALDDGNANWSARQTEVLTAIAGR